METNQPVALKTLPVSIISMIFGICSIVFSCFFVGLAFGIVALILASKGSKIYNANPSIYSKGSLSMIKTGKITGLIGTIISGVYIIFWIIMVTFFAASGGTWYMLDYM